MKTKRKRKKGIGTSLALLPALFLAAFLPLTAGAKKKAAPDSYAIISGSVFQESGHALPNAEVTLAPEVQPGGSPGKTQKMEAVSDARGEFLFRVSPVPMHYNVTVAAKGYQILRKSVIVEGEQRVEVTFQLEQESK